MDLRYWADAGRAFAHHARRTPGFVRDVAAAGLRADREPSAPARFLLDAYPEGIEVDMGRVAYRRSNLSPLEQYALAAIARVRRPRRVFEIGTYDGATTLLLARNTDAEVLTLDLPPEEAAVVAHVEHEAHNVKAGAGSRLREEAERVTQLYGDSRTFDFSPWYESVDLVFIDAGHDYESVKADTNNALRLRSEHGVIVWDDYTAGWPGVVRAVEETGLPVFRVEGTALAIFDPTCR